MIKKIVTGMGLYEITYNAISQNHRSRKVLTWGGGRATALSMVTVVWGGAPAQSWGP